MEPPAARLDWVDLGSGSEEDAMVNGGGLGDEIGGFFFLSLLSSFLFFDSLLSLHAKGVNTEGHI